MGTSQQAHVARGESARFRYTYRAQRHGEYYTPKGPDFTCCMVSVGREEWQLPVHGCMNHRNSHVRQFRCFGDASPHRDCRDRCALVTAPTIGPRYYEQITHRLCRGDIAAKISRLCVLPPEPCRDWANGDLMSDRLHRFFLYTGRASLFPVLTDLSL